MTPKRAEPSLVSTRVTVAFGLGVAAGIATGLLGYWPEAASVGWVCAAGVFLGWTWSVVARMDPAATADHASREEPARRVADLLVLGSSVASLIGVGYLLVRAGTQSGTTEALAAALGVFSVAISWAVVNTVYALRYASIYFAEPIGGIDFNSASPPRYSDFLYVSFTLGMTYQVSDTSLRTSGLRSFGLSHALLSYGFGSFVVATAVNLVGSLARVHG